MNLLSLVLFLHVVGMLAVFVSLGLEVAGPDGPRAVMLRTSLVLTSISGAILGRGLIEDAALWDRGWIAVTVPAMAIIAVTAAQPRMLTVRVSLALAIVFLMVSRVPFDGALSVVGLALIVALAIHALARRRSQIVSAVPNR